MSYETVKVELENGHVRPLGTEKLPAKARALLTLLDAPTTAAPTCAELADRWDGLKKLPPDEAVAFANDIEKSRASLFRTNHL